MTSDSKVNLVRIIMMLFLSRGAVTMIAAPVAIVLCVDKSLRNFAMI